MTLSDLKIKYKLMLSFGIMAALLLLTVALAHYRLSHLAAEIRLGNEDRYPKTVLAHGVKDELNETARSMRNLLLMTDTAAIEKEIASLHDDARKNDVRLATLDKTVTSAEGRALLARIAEVRKQFGAHRAEFLATFKSGNKEQALSILLEKVRPNQMQYFELLDEMIALQEKLMQAAGSQAASDAAEADIMMTVLALLALGVSIVMGVLTTRSITVPLAEAVAVARRVADGDLSSQIQVNSSDESGQLLAALKDMNDSLSAIVHEVRAGSETICSAAGQIAAGNLDLSSRTEQQAASLEETASSMEEMTSTVRQNADNARQANALATQASEAAIAGGNVVAQVVHTMGAINEASKKISDIIGVIDSIAFQTNILALNAAVEAARAGEQGRGFAVVATEVRNLAQRSAAAAKDIKTLIDMSSEQVRQGSALVDEAGTGMENIVSRITSVTDMMSEILSAGLEQTAGIEQINRTVNEMDQSTQQNAALVEEAAAAANALQDEAVQLDLVISRFHFGQPNQGGALAQRRDLETSAQAVRPALSLAQA